MFSAETCVHAKCPPAMQAGDYVYFVSGARLMGLAGPRSSVESCYLLPTQSVPLSTKINVILCIYLLF